MQIQATEFIFVCLCTKGFRTEYFVLNIQSGSSSLGEANSPFSSSHWGPVVPLEMRHLRLSPFYVYWHWPCSDLVYLSISKSGSYTEAFPVFLCLESFCPLFCNVLKGAFHILNHWAPQHEPKDIWTHRLGILKDPKAEMASESQRVKKAWWKVCATSLALS